MNGKSRTSTQAQLPTLRTIVGKNKNPLFFIYSFLDTTKLLCPFSDFQPVGSIDLFFRLVVGIAPKSLPTSPTLPTL